MSRDYAAEIRDCADNAVQVDAEQLREWAAEIERLRAEIVQLRGVLAFAHGIVYTKAKASFHAEGMLQQIDKVLAETTNKESSDE